MSDDKLTMPDGHEVEQGGPEDRATWWTCTQCKFNGPNVGTNLAGEHRCMGRWCGGTVQNPNVPRISPPDTAQPPPPPKPRASLCGCGEVHAPGERCGPF